jgi:hypothetical protein
MERLVFGKAETAEQAIERLVFGKAETAEQARLRLPETQHPKYWPDEVIRRLADFKTCLSEADEKAGGIPLEQRCIRFDKEAMAELERISFRRKPEITIQEEVVPTEGKFAKIFYSRMNGSVKTFWWQISDMTPEINISGHRLLCVERNPDRTTELKHRYDDCSDFYLLLLNCQEEKELIEELIRKG